MHWFFIPLLRGTSSDEPRLVTHNFKRWRFNNLSLRLSMRRHVWIHSQLFTTRPETMTHSEVIGVSPCIGTSPTGGWDGYNRNLCPTILPKTTAWGRIGWAGLISCCDRMASREGAIPSIETEKWCQYHSNGKWDAITSTFSLFSKSLFSGTTWVVDSFTISWVVHVLHCSGVPYWRHSPVTSP